MITAHSSGETWSNPTRTRRVGAASAGTDTCRSQRHPRNQVLSSTGRSARVRGPNDAVPVTGGRRDTRSVKRSFVVSAPASTSGSAAPSSPRSRILPGTPVRLTEAMGLPVPTRALWSGLACYVGWFAGRVSHVSAETPAAPSGESRSMIMLTSMVLPVTRRAAVVQPVAGRSQGTRSSARQQAFVRWRRYTVPSCGRIPAMSREASRPEIRCRAILPHDLALLRARDGTSLAGLDLRDHSPAAKFECTTYHSPSMRCQTVVQR